MALDNNEELVKLLEEAARVMSLSYKQWKTGALTDRELNQLHTQVAELIAQAIGNMSKDPSE